MYKFFICQCGLQPALSFRVACPGDPEIHHLVGSTGAGSSPWKGRGQDGADARPSRDEDEDDVCSRDDQVVSRSGLARAREPDTRLASLQPEYAPSGSRRPPPPSLTTSELPPTWRHPLFCPCVRARVVVAGWWVIGGRNGGDRCVLPRVWEEQQEPRVSLPIPKLWDRLGLTRAGGGSCWSWRT